MENLPILDNFSPGELFIHVYVSEMDCCQFWASNASYMQINIESRATGEVQEEGGKWEKGQEPAKIMLRLAVCTSAFFKGLNLASVSLLVLKAGFFEISMWKICTCWDGVMLVSSCHFTFATWKTDLLTQIWLNRLLCRVNKIKELFIMIISQVESWKFIILGIDSTPKSQALILSSSLSTPVFW